MVDINDAEQKVLFPGTHTNTVVFLGEKVISSVILQSGLWSGLRSGLQSDYAFPNKALMMLCLHCLLLSTPAYFACLVYCAAESGLC